MGIGFGQIIILFLIVLLFFGAKRLPEIARAMGKAANEFHRAKNEVLDSPVKTMEAGSEVSHEIDTDKVVASVKNDEEKNKA